MTKLNSLIIGFLLIASSSLSFASSYHTSYELKCNVSKDLLIELTSTLLQSENNKNEISKVMDSFTAEYCWWIGRSAPASNKLEKKISLNIKEEDYLEVSKVVHKVADGAEINQQDTQIYEQHKLLNDLINSIFETLDNAGFAVNAQFSLR